MDLLTSLQLICGDWENLIIIKNLIIKVGDHFAYRQNDRWHKTRIVSIEENGQVLDETSNGRYGIEVEKAIPNNVCLYLIQ